MDAGAHEPVDGHGRAGVVGMADVTARSCRFCDEPAAPGCETCSPHLDKSDPRTIARFEFWNTQDLLAAAVAGEQWDTARRLHQNLVRLCDELGIVEAANVAARWVASHAIGDNAVEIRPATDDDLPTVRALLVESGLAFEDVDYSAYTPPLLVAVRDGEIVAYMHAAFSRPYAVVTECVVKREFQGRGYGIRLLQAMELLMRMSGITA